MMSEEIMVEMDFDVVVVGAGNAALRAALAAYEGGAKVLVLERASEDEKGGSGLTAGSVFGKLAGTSAARFAVGNA
jgi:flavin-dependent dehydrogenase